MYSLTPDIENTCREYPKDDNCISPSYHYADSDQLNAYTPTGSIPIRPNAKINQNKMKGKQVPQE